MSPQRRKLSREHVRSNQLRFNHVTLTWMLFYYYILHPTVVVTSDVQMCCIYVFGLFNYLVSGRLSRCGPKHLTIYGGPKPTIVHVLHTSAMCRALVVTYVTNLHCSDCAIKNRNIRILNIQHILLEIHVHLHYVSAWYFFYVMSLLLRRFSHDDRALRNNALPTKTFLWDPIVLPPCIQINRRHSVKKVGSVNNPVLVILFLFCSHI